MSGRPMTEREKTMRHIVERQERVHIKEGEGVDGVAEGELAMEKFRVAYSDIYENPELFKIARDIDRLMLDTRDNRPAWERYQDIGEMIRLGESKEFQARAVETGGQVNTQVHGEFAEVRRSDEVQKIVNDRARRQGKA